MDTTAIKAKTLIFSLAAVYICEFSGRIIIHGFHLNSFGVTGVVRAAEIVLMGAIVSYFGKGLQDIGLHPVNMLNGIKKGIIWSVGFGIAASVILVILQLIGIRFFNVFISSMPSDINSIILIFVVGGIVSPVAEEMFFRGLLYGFLRRWGAFFAILVSMIVFVLLHSTTLHMPITQIVGGLIFAIAYEVEKNLMVPVTIHILGNMGIFILSLIF